MFDCKNLEICKHYFIKNPSYFMKINQEELRIEKDAKAMKKQITRNLEGGSRKCFCHFNKYQFETMTNNKQMH